MFCFLALSFINWPTSWIPSLESFFFAHLLCCFWPHLGRGIFRLFLHSERRTHLGLDSITYLFLIQCVYIPSLSLPVVFDFPFSESTEFIPSSIKPTVQFFFGSRCAIDRCRSMPRRSCRQYPLAAEVNALLALQPVQEHAPSPCMDGARKTSLTSNL